MLIDDIVVLRIRVSGGSITRSGFVIREGSVDYYYDIHGDYDLLLIPLIQPMIPSGHGDIILARITLRMKPCN